jgi:hypothetical protein
MISALHGRVNEKPKDSPPDVAKSRYGNVLRGMERISSLRSFLRESTRVDGGKGVGWG